MKDGKRLEAVKKYFLERKYVLWLLLWLVQVVWYFLLNNYQKGGHLIHIGLDDKIPFVKEFVIFYELWYLYIAFAHIWTFFHSKREFLVMCCLIFFANFLSMFICTVYPSMHDLRPAESAMGNDFFTALVKWNYANDNPYCILPSMHCLLAIVITVGLITSDSLKGNLLVKILCPIYTVLVMLSTVFIKQHSIVDVFLAMGLSVPICLLTYFVILPKKRFEQVHAPLPPAEATPALLFLSQDDEYEEEKEEEGD